MNAVGMQWVNELADYNLTIKYQQGKENVDTDALSWRPMNITEYRKECSESLKGSAGLTALRPKMEELGPILCAAVLVDKLLWKDGSGRGHISRKELGDKQRMNKVIGPVYQAVEVGARLNKEVWIEMSWESKILPKSFKKLVF